MRRGQVQAKKAVWEQWKAAGRQVMAVGGSRGRMGAAAGQVRALILKWHV